jgi:NAD(P)H-flavin reductase
VSSPAIKIPIRSPWLPYRARITNVRPEASGISTYELEFLDPKITSEYHFAPGQFNMLYLPGYGESAISMSSDPGTSGSLWHTIRIAGTVTRALAKKRIGDTVALRGPFGSSWPVEESRGKDIILACGGVGLAPLRPVICHILRHREEYGRVTLLHGARTPGDLLYPYEYDEWRRGGIDVEVTVDIGSADWAGNIGVVPVLFYRLRLNPEQTRIFTCGPEVMMRFVIFEALARRVRKDAIHLSMERNMNCALGLCGHCQLGPAFVCKDGPVFTYQQMEPYLHLEDF